MVRIKAIPAAARILSAVNRDGWQELSEVKGRP
jgi:hypothetical protein